MITTTHTHEEQYVDIHNFWKSAFDIQHHEEEAYPTCSTIAQAEIVKR